MANDVTTFPEVPYLDSRGVTIRLDDQVVYPAHHHNQVEIVYGKVSGFNQDKERICIIPISRSLADKAIWPGDSIRPTHIQASRTLVVGTMPRATKPTRAELIAADRARRAAARIEDVT